MSKADASEESSSKAVKEEDEKPKKSENINHEEDCKTPSSQEQKIPAPESCPPAPKKRKRGVSRKRKLPGQLQFFENSGKEEVDSFFQSSSENSSRVAPETTTSKKRRKTS